jgi:hypothetical protein
VEEDDENNPAIHPRDAHHNPSIPHPNYSDIAHELYNQFASHWNNEEDDCSQFCKKSIVMSRFLFNGDHDANPDYLATFIKDAKFDDGCDADIMIKSYFQPGYTFRNGPPARAYNTNPNIIIPIDSSLYVDLVDNNQVFIWIIGKVL